MVGIRVGEPIRPVPPFCTLERWGGNETDKTVRMTIECDNLRIWANRKQFYSRKFILWQTTGNRGTQSLRLGGDFSLYARSAATGKPRETVGHKVRG